MEDKEKQTNRTDNFEELSDTVSIPNKEKTISVSKFKDIKLTIPFKKEVEEMALCLQSYSNINQAYYNGEWHSDDVYYGLAKSLYHNDFRIVPKDSVVFSKEEQEIRANELIETLKAVKNQASKETAEKIITNEIKTIKNIRDACVLPEPAYRKGYIDCCNGILFYLENNITKQFGAEIKE